MGGYPVAAVTYPTLRVILDGPRVARSAGPITWKNSPNTAVGILPVDVTVDHCRTASLRIKLLRLRPYEIGLQYIVNDAPMHRVDVNAVHNSWELNTHSHTYVPSDGSETAAVVDDFIHVPFGPSVPRDTFRKCFEEFAKRVHVALIEPYWSDPWKGGA